MTENIVNAQGVAQGISNGLRPQEGPRALGIIFKVRNSVPAVCRLDLNGSGLSMVQTIFVDNSENAVPVNVVISGTSQTFTVLAQTQVFLPVLMRPPLEITVVGKDDLDVPVKLINVEMSPIVYSAAPSSVIVTGVVPITGNVTALCSQNGHWFVAQDGEWLVGAEQSGDWLFKQFDPVGAPFTVTQAAGNIWNDFDNNCAQNDSGEITVPGVVLAQPGRLFSVMVLVPGAAGNMRDIAGGSRLLPLPAVLGTINIPGGLPFNSLYADPGAAQIIRCFYSLTL